jgi:peroxiredoxin
MLPDIFRRTRDNSLVLLRLPVEKPISSSHTEPEKLRGPRPIRESRIERNGIKAGTVAPAFTLPDIDGRSISLDQYRGRRVLLVFSDTQCGPCSDLAPHLTHAYRRRRDNTTEIIVISRGDVEDNRRKAASHGFEFPVVLQERSKLSRKYGIFMTPVAFLIGEDGRTARDVAIGPDQIDGVLREEFPRTALEGLAETVDDISKVLASPMRRRDALRVTSRIVATTVLSAIGLERVGMAACSPGLYPCGSACFNPSTHKCCRAAQNLVCSLSVACCPGAVYKCCAPTEICNTQTGQCVPQAQP